VEEESARLCRAEGHADGEDVRVSPNADRAARQLEKIREVFDIDPNGMAPRVVVVPQGIAEAPRNEQFMRRAAVVVGV